MPVDRKFLLQHYASMSDEELFSIDPDELVEAAREIYDEEVRKRDVPGAESSSERSGPTDEDVDSEPEWLEDAAEAYSVYVSPGKNAPESAVDARHVLEAARIPAFLELFEETGQEGQYQYRWRVMVPAKLIHRATSVLDRDLLNQQFESEWKGHLELLSDQELRVMEPRYAFCGLYDKLERINRAYDEELDRRQLKK